MSGPARQAGEVAGGPAPGGEEVAAAVLYNADCPVCRVEIEAYRRRAEAAGVALVFEPLPAAPAWGLTEDEAARRLHVRAGGRVLAGMPAFRALWRATPGMGWLARLSAWPLVAPALGWSYDRIAAPLLHALHRRRLRRRGARPDSAGPGPAA